MNLVFYDSTDVVGVFIVPIKVTAPEGTIVNCRYPAPVAGRHIVGMYVPMPILKALYHVMPERVLAEGAGAVAVDALVTRSAS